LIVNTARLDLAGYVIRMSVSEISKRVINCESERKMRVGRSKARRNDVNHDIRKVQCTSEGQRCMAEKLRRGQCPLIAVQPLRMMRK